MGSYPKALKWNAKQVQIFKALNTGASHHQIAKDLQVNISTVVKVHNAVKKGQSPATPYVPKQSKKKTKPGAADQIAAGSAALTQANLAAKKLESQGANTSSPDDDKEKKETPPPPGISPGEIATQMRMVSTPITVAITPIMQNARMYLTVKKGWRPDMPWENFFDTIFYRYFLSCGVRIAPWYEEEQLDLEEGKTKVETGGAQASASPKPAMVNRAKNSGEVQFTADELKLAAMVAKYLKQMA